jgi:hypothetical protein
MLLHYTQKRSILQGAGADLGSRTSYCGLLTGLLPWAAMAHRSRDMSVGKGLKRTKPLGETIYYRILSLERISNCSKSWYNVLKTGQPVQNS